MSFFPQAHGADQPNWDVLPQFEVIYVGSGARGAPPFLNGWSNFDAAVGSAGRSAGYYLDSMGFVHLEGWIKNTVIGSAAFVLPVGFRIACDPAAAAISFPCVAGGVFGVCNVYGNGNIIPAAGTPGSFNLNSIIYRAKFI